MCIGTVWGANSDVIIDVVNFIVAVTVITELICGHHMTLATVSLECVFIRRVSCSLTGEGGDELSISGYGISVVSCLL